MSKVIVGLSGGVDSAVAAYLLKKEGYDVIGVTLRTWVTEDGAESRCCEIDDARRVAWKLNIPYYALNCADDFKKYVTDPFVDEYVSGRTPNPCVECNRYVKWERMLYYARVLNADYVATGHYASVIRLDNGRYTLRRAEHIEKDQTYMLYRLTQEQLARTLMPLGRYRKDEVREIAENIGLPVAKKPDSQEICFITEGNYTDYIERNIPPGILKEGKFVDLRGNVMGRHKGIHYYTPGQRRGLGLALGYPAYVCNIDAVKNEVMVGDENALYFSSLICGRLNFMSIAGLREGEKKQCLVKIRHHHKAQRALLERSGESELIVMFENPVKASARGQSAVFYDLNGCIIGGGVILDILDKR